MVLYLIKLIILSSLKEYFIKIQEIFYISPIFYMNKVLLGNTYCLLGTMYIYFFLLFTTLKQCLIRFVIHYIAKRKSVINYFKFLVTVTTICIIIVNVTDDIA